MKLKQKLPRTAIQAEKALREAVYETIKDHKRTGDPIVVWRNGKVVRVPAKKINLKKLRKGK